MEFPTVSELVHDPLAPTPVQRHATKVGPVYVKRDDLFEIAGVRGGKVRTCWHLAQGATGLVTAGSRQSPQVNIVANIARALGIPCRVHTPGGTWTPEMQAADAAGAAILQHRPGHNSVIIKRARDDAAAHGYVEIPFGMECEAAVAATSAQVANLPGEARRVVVPVGSGMSLCGVLDGLRGSRHEWLRGMPVLGVLVGAEPTKRLHRYGPPFWTSDPLLELVRSAYDYHQLVHSRLLPFVLDPIYEAKCANYLEAGDLLWVVGVRQTSMEVVEA